MELSESQRGQLQLLHQAIQGYGRLPAVLLTGPPGAGKRTLARQLAGDLGAGFEEVPANDHPDALSARLVGTPSDAQRAQQGGGPAPGLLGREGPVLIFLSGLHSLPGGLAQILRAAIAERRYVDALGGRWGMSDDLLIIGSRAISSDATIGSDHWLWTAFDRRISVTPPSAPGDITTVTKSTLQNLGVAPQHRWKGSTGIGSALRALVRQLFHGRWDATNLGALPGFDEDHEIMETLATVVGAGDHLHLLRRVLETVVLTNKDKPIRQEHILQALAGETRWLLARLRYRGRELSEGALRDWLEQFPAALRPVAFQVFSSIASSHYIGQDTFHDALGFLIRAAGIPPGASVSFCKWQELGASGPRVAHAMKNQANWRLLPEIDLAADDKGWPTIDGGLPQWFVIADDMVGSGNTLRRLTRRQDAPVKRLLQRFPAAQLRILIVVAFETPLREAKADLDEFRDRVEVVGYRLLGAADRCFTKESKILPDPTHRELLLRFCRDGGGGRIDISPAFRLGYNEMATVLVFFDTVPNNSLPMLWYRGPAWEPLFPASG